MKKKYYNNFKIAFQAFLGRYILTFIYKTNFWDTRGLDQINSLLSDGKSVIVSVWHGKLLAPFMQLANNGYFGLVGTYKDGEIISRIGTSLGWNIIRGSSSDGGSKIFVEIIKLLRDNSSVFAITPDGPQGPAKKPKPGIIKAAQKTGSAIIPVGVFSTKNWQFKNWHTFFLEKPLGKIFIKYGDPIFFDQNQDFNVCKDILIEAMQKTELDNKKYANKKTN